MAGSSCVIFTAHFVLGTGDSWWKRRKTYRCKVSYGLFLYLCRMLFGYSWSNSGPFVEICLILSDYIVHKIMEPERLFWRKSMLSEWSGSLFRFSFSFNIYSASFCPECNDARHCPEGTQRPVEKHKRNSTSGCRVVFASGPR